MRPAHSTGRVGVNVSVAYDLQWVEMTLHRLAAISHVAQLVDVEPVIARRQARDLTRHLHRRRGAARLQIFLDATLNIFSPRHLCECDVSRDAVPCHHSHGHVHQVGLAWRKNENYGKYAIS